LESAITLLEETLTTDPAIEVRETCELALRRINQKKSMSNDDKIASISTGPRFLSVDPALPASLDLSVNQLRYSLYKRNNFISFDLYMPYT
jgi:deoxyhypusine monooxygenase